jgi:omega-amidase
VLPVRAKKLLRLCTSTGNSLDKITFLLPDTILSMNNQNKLRCLLVQSGLFWADAEANRQKLEKIVRAHADESDLIVFPETFTSGFLGDSADSLENMQGETVSWIKSLSRETNTVLCGSMAIATKAGTVNRFLWAQPDDVLHHYDKRHLFAFGGENERYVAGTQRKVINYRGWRICPQICYDLRFPAWCRNQDDYDALLFVANWPEPRTPAWSALLKARAIENQCYVIGVNRSGSDPRGLQYAGASVIYDPLGEAVLELGPEEGTGTGQIDLRTVSDFRSKLPFQEDADSFEFL